jgi:DNA invertase Pin-like site-specific DNA recombinase
MNKICYVDYPIVLALCHMKTGIPLKEIIHKIGISKQTFYWWKQLYSGWIPSRYTD